MRAWLSKTGLTAIVFYGSVVGVPAVADAASDAPDCIVIVSVDALRADRLSCYGYERATSPNIDALLGAGVRFEQARTVEPLTNPALTSMITGIPPHEHGATRNGLRMKPGLESLTKVLRRDGWFTAAFVSNWTLRDELSLLGEHFDSYNGVFTRKRWFGMVSSEATAEDVTDRALEWLQGFQGNDRGQPFLLWVHYVEPHAPYRFQEDFASALGIGRKGETSKRDRYDTEVAFTDHQIGRLLDGLAEHVDPAESLIVFVADHGESLGEHSYWGHGRKLYEPALRIPMGVSWTGGVAPGVIQAQALIIDLAPTVLELVGSRPPASFRGTSWAGVLRGQGEPVERPLCYQAHRGAVQFAHESDNARANGLLEIGLVAQGRKETVRIRSGRRKLFDLASDPDEKQSLADPASEPSPELRACMDEIQSGLSTSDVAPAAPLSEEDRVMLERLGYLEETAN